MAGGSGEWAAAEARNERGSRAGAAGLRRGGGPATATGAGGGEEAEELFLGGAGVEGFRRPPARPPEAGSRNPRPRPPSQHALCPYFSLSPPGSLPGLGLGACGRHTRASVKVDKQKEEAEVAILSSSWYLCGQYPCLGATISSARLAGIDVIYYTLPYSVLCLTI